MYPTADTAAALYPYTAEPGMTVIASQSARQRVLLRSPQGYNSGATFRPVAPTDGVSTAQENVAPLESRLTQADMTAAQLLRMEQWDFDWDGSDAAKPLPFSLKDARAFIRALAPESVIPRAALHADGHAILFVRGPDAYAELEFLGNQQIGFYARRGGQEWTDEIDFDGRTLPEGLQQIGFVV